MILKSNNKVLALFAIITMILCSGHAYQTIYPEVLNCTILLACVLLAFCLQRDKLVIGGYQIIALIFTVMVLCTALAHMGRGLYTYIVVLCMILGGYGVSQIYDFRKVVNYYRTIMTIVTVVAVVGYILLQNTTLLNTLPVKANYNGVEYQVSGIFNFIPTIIERNCGMFWEPGLFATHLTIAMVFEIMCYEKPSIWRLVLYSVAVFTANSSAGFVLWFLCILLLFVRKANLSKNLFLALFGFAVMISGIIIMLNFDTILVQTGLADNEYFQKLSTDSINDSSRMKALEHNMKSFLTAPIFGVGFVGAAANMAYVADTSTSTYLMSVFGITGALYTVCWCYGVFKNIKTNILVKTLLLAIILIITNKEPHYQIFFTWCMLFFLLKGDFSGGAQNCKTATDNN